VRDGELVVGFGVLGFVMTRVGESSMGSFDLWSTCPLIIFIW